MPVDDSRATRPERQAMFPQVFGKYVLEREIGAGGMARVYLATLRGAGGFEKRLVLKQIRAELASDAAFVRRFVEEAKTAVELSHPNIVAVYELGVEQGVYYIAMEFCAGVTLSEIMACTGPLDPFEGAYVGVEICRALDYAHRRAGIVHRDVTPRNVLIDDEGAVRLIDFGIAAPVSTGSDMGPREVFGSPGHMPPEQLAGTRLSPATDVFAVGALLMEAWTGEAPFRRRTAEESARALEQKPPRLGDVVAELEPLSDLTQSCLSRDPEQRPKSAEDLARPLREFLKTADLGDVAQRLAERVRRTRGSLRPGASQPDSTPSTPAGLAADASPDSDGDAPVTRTFAARDEWTAWTRQLDTGPDPAGTKSPAEDDVSTRRLSEPKALAPKPEPNPRVRWAGAAAVIAIGGAMALAASLQEPPRSQGVPKPPVTEAPSAVAPPAPAPPPVPPDPPAPSVPVAEASAIKTASPTSPPTPAFSTSPERATATLQLTADPPAVVTVEGEGVQKTLPTPVRSLALRAGSYRVTFRNETYGPPVATRVSLVGGGVRSVHADFREAEPRVTVR